MKTKILLGASIALAVGFLGSLELRARPKQFLVDLPMSSTYGVKQAVEENLDVLGVDFEKNTLTILSNGTPHFPQATAIREVPFVPDTSFKQPSDIEAALKLLATDNPTLVKLESIGTSLEGRETFAIRVGYGKPKSVLIDAMHHAREVMTPEVALDIAEQLIKREKEPKVAAWLASFDVWIVPMVNPDGNAKVWRGNAMWRKNNRGGYGVDVNRNYPTDFAACQGSSGNPNSDIYRGPSPASEPETKNLIALAAKIKPVLNISYHSFSEIVIYPYGCAGKHIEPAHRARYEGIGKGLASRLKRDSGNGSYRPGTSYELLYSVDGGSVDHMWKAFGAYSFVVEINSSTQGFQPSFAWRESTVKRQRPGWEFAFDEAIALAK